MYSFAPDHLWSKVDQSGGPDACWPFKLSRNKLGYGRLQFRKDGGKWTFTASRVAYVLVNGPVGPGVVIRHLCGNPPCCNPAHLAPGTPADNARDTVAMGRTTKGEKNPAAKLKEAQVTAIRERIAAGERYAVLAKEFGIHYQTVYQISARIIWRDGAGL